MEKPFDTARWIWHKDAFGTNEYVTFDIVFTAEEPAACRLFISANSHYALYAGDRLLNADQYPDYENYKAYDELSLTDAAVRGENRLTLCAYCQGEDSSTCRAFPAGVLFSVYEGDTCLAASGPETLCRRDERYARKVEKITPQLSYSFAFNALAPLPEKEKAVVCDYAWRLVARPIKKMIIDGPEPARITAMGRFTETRTDGTPAERMQAAAIVTAAPVHRPALPSEEGVAVGGNYAVIDLGREQAGYLELDLELPEACDVFIGWGEHLEDLRVRTFVGPRYYAATWHGPAGRSRFFYPFKRLGLRYLTLEVFAPDFKIHYAGVRCARYPLARLEDFSCADHLHERIYHVGVRTLLMCMHDHYEDCPWREQALYTMDGRNQMLCGYYTFKEYEFARASLRLAGLSLRPDHTLELTSPARVSITIPSFTAVYMLQLGEYLKYSGDEAFTREMLPVGMDIADGFLARVEKNGLIRRFVGPQYWNFYEWQTGLEGICGNEDEAFQQAFDAPLAAFVSIGLQAMAGVCRRLGRKEDAERYETGAAALNRALDETFWAPEKGCYATTLRDGKLSHFGELTQSLAVYANAVPKEKLESVLATLTGGQGEDFYPVTLSHSIFKYEALLRRPEQYGRFVFDHVAKTFGDMLAKDATTFWETSDGACAFDNAGSLCHAWSAIPTYLYLRYCADSRGEGITLRPEQYGLYECRVSEVRDPSRRIIDDAL